MLTLVLSLALSAAAPDTATAPAPAPSATNAKPVKPKKICRSNVNTGSRLKGRTCKTQDQWDNEPQDVRNDIRVNSGAGGN